MRDRRRSEGRDGGYDRGGFRGPRYRSRSRSPMDRDRGRGPHRPPQGHDWDGPPRGGFDEREREREGGGPPPQRKASQNVEPMDSYKAFMMRQDENSTPETYQQRYEEYKKKYMQRLLRAFFDDHKGEEWLQERYSPAIRARTEQQKQARKVAEAKQFGERLRAGVSTVNLDESNQLTGADFENDMESSARVLYVRRVPCACPVGTLSDAIKKAGGSFQHLYLSDPVKKSAFDFDRSAYIVYETAEAAADALPKIHNTFVEDGDLFPPFRLQVSQHRSRAPLKTPSYLSVPERLEFDYQQALKLAQALDQRLFTKDAELRRYGIDALLDHDEVTAKYSTNRQKLDVTIAYLRRVHHYIYYAGVQCIDMGDIMHAHPALFCRPEPSTRDLEEEKARQDAAAAAAADNNSANKNEEGENGEAAETEAGAEKEASAAATPAPKAIGGWAAQLDEKIKAYLEELLPEAVAEKRAAEKAVVDEIESREEAALESTYTNYGEKAGDDGKHRCRLCTKLFKAMDFVKKHIRNKHPELVVDKIAEVGESYMWEQYQKDEQRPLPPIETINNPVALGGSRGPAGRNNSSYQGRGNNRPSPYGGGRGGSYYRDEGPGYRSRGPPPPRDRVRRGSFDRPSRSPPRGGGYNRPPPPPEGDLPVDPRQITKSYQDLDNLQDTKVELSFDALESLPPPKKKTKV